MVSGMASSFKMLRLGDGYVLPVSYYHVITNSLDTFCRESCKLLHTIVSSSFISIACLFRFAVYLNGLQPNNVRAVQQVIRSRDIHWMQLFVT